MAGISSAIGNIGIAKQSAKGSPVAQPTTKWKLAGTPTLMPVKNRDRYVVTDVGRDAGPGFTAGMLVQGDVPLYLEPDGFAILAYAVLGANADTALLPTAPAALTAAAASGAGLGVGAYKYQVTFYNGIGDSPPSAEATVTTTGGNQQVALSAIPVGPAGTTARRIWRTAVGGATGTEKLVATIADNVATTYTDTASDAAQATGAAVPVAGTGGGQHVATPANDLPWMTFFRMVGNAIFEQFVDCKVNSMRVESAAGGALLVTLNVIGIRSVFSAVDWTGTALDPAGYLHAEAAGAIKLDTVAQPIFRIALEVNNNLSPFQADDYVPADVDPGKRDVTLTFAMRFTGPTAAPDYRAFYYGSDAGTALSPIVGTHAFDVLFTRGGRSVDFTLPRVEYAAVPVNADPGGAPLEVEVATTVELPVGSPIITITTKDAAAAV